MVPVGRLHIGRIIRCYDHGYMVIWNYDSEIGIEANDKRYDRIHELCPSPGHLLGTLAVYQTDSSGRAAAWFTAFSEEQLEVLARKTGHHAMEALSTINTLLSDARAASSDHAEGFDLEFINKEAFSKAWNAHANAIQRNISESKR